jgi:hypothetical protein
MRRQALLLSLTLVAGCGGGESRGTDQTYAFGETTDCFRAAGFQVHDTDASPTPPEVPHTVQIIDRAAGRTLYFLLFVKSVALAKQHEADPPPPSSLSGVKSSTERRGNVIIVTFLGGPLGSPSKSVGRQLLARCLPQT